MPTVILVDDSPVYARIVADYLKSTPLEVLAMAFDGKSAVHAFKKYKPDFVIMDVVLPRTSGFDACNHIMKYFKNAKVVLYSAVQFDHFASKAYFCGARDFLLKPFNQYALVSTIEKILAEEEFRKMASVKKKKNK